MTEESRRMDHVDIVVDLVDCHKQIVLTVQVGQHQTQLGTGRNNVALPDYICALALNQNKIKDLVVKQAKQKIKLERNVKS